MSDDRFMNQFNNRLNLEPPPQWTLQKKEFPWLELGWAFAAALLLALHWTELRFGFFSAHMLMSEKLSHIPMVWIYSGLAAAYGATVWLAPRISLEF